LLLESSNFLLGIPFVALVFTFLEEFFLGEVEELLVALGERGFYLADLLPQLFVLHFH